MDKEHLASYKIKKKYLGKIVLFFWESVAQKLWTIEMTGDVWWFEYDKAVEKQEYNWIVLGILAITANGEDIIIWTQYTMSS